MNSAWVMTSAVLAFLLPVRGVSGEDAERYTRAAGRLRDLINAGDYPAIQKQFDAEMDRSLPLEKSTAFFKGLSEQCGKLEKLEAPRIEPPSAFFDARFERGRFELQLVLDEKDRLSGLWFRPRKDPEAAPGRNRTQLSLPFKGRWLVFWGGDSKELNYHHDIPNQRFAFDLLGVGEDGKTRRALSGSNEDYHAFGREVLAPADGTVIEAIDGVRDNEPGSMNSFSALGNCVVIQHRKDEVSLLAHLKRGSVKVKAGDKVKAGQLLGLCGNSGNSSEPHLHYHLQHTPVIQDGLGIKCFFRKVAVTSGGKTLAREEHSPAKGEVIKPQ